MKEITTDLWAMLLPEEWFAEQDDETIVVSDDDEVSVVEITPLLPEKGASTADLLAELHQGDSHKTALAEMDAYYKEFEEDDMFWREWYCDGGDLVLAISHGCDVDNKNMDDSAVDEILSTLVLLEVSEEAGDEKGATE